MEQQITFDLFGLTIKTIPISDNGILFLPNIILLLLVIFIQMTKGLIHSYNGWNYEANKEFRQIRVTLIILFLSLLFAFNI